MQYRWIDGDELAVLDPIIESRNWTPLPRERGMAKALIVENDCGEVIGFNVVQLCVHTEPMWVSPQYRGKSKGVSRNLAMKTADYLRGHGITNWRCSTDTPHVAELCEENGMILVKGKVYRGGA